MAVKIKLNDILEMIDMQYEGTTAWVNTQNGELFLMEEAFIRDAEDGEPFDHLYEEDQEK
ncbi:hypothetical protein ABRT01_14165 [Lentibacillus sp. L22]|uniref:hypothetical protein n=1 Tax=Lentibacillus TaxID=175304 RepID=UPI0022B0D8C0|nr:hypothetical protein [Lentibacillus daqui]